MPKTAPITKTAQYGTDAQARATMAATKRPTATHGLKRTNSAVARTALHAKERMLQPWHTNCAPHAQVRELHDAKFVLQHRF